MQVIDISTDFANIRVVALDREANREFTHRHATHQLIKQYRKEYGAVATRSLMDELDAYHNPREVGVK